MDRTISERHGLDHRLPAALTNGELGFVYQPIMRTSDRRVVGVEALARLRTPDLRDLGPDVFLPLLFHLGYASQVTEFALRVGLADLETLAERFDNPDLTLSINLSPSQLREGATLINQVEHALADAAAPARRLTLELVEDLAVPDRSLVATPLSAIRAMGVRVALDDFGTGRSSLEHLMDLEVDQIKIDRRFVTPAEKNPRAHAAAAALIRLGVDLDLEIVAEGVESDELIPELGALGCHCVQGWAVGPPVSTDSTTPDLLADVVVAHDSPDLPDAFLTELERQLLEGVLLTVPQAEAALDRLSAPDATDPLRARIGRVQSWLLHIVDGNSRAVGNHVVAANRTLRAGDIGRAGAEFSRAAVGARQANEVASVQRYVSRACELLMSYDCEPEQRFRATYNLCWMLSDTLRDQAGPELLARLFEVGDPDLPERLRWTAGYSAAVVATELVEVGAPAANQLGLAHPEQLLPKLSESHDRLGPGAQITARQPLAPLVARWGLVDGTSPDDVEATLEANAEVPTQAISDAWWQVARSELAAKRGDVDEAIRRSRDAVRSFTISSFYKPRIVHCWRRQVAILSGGGRHREAVLAQTQLLDSAQSDFAAMQAELLGPMLEFDLQSVLAEQIAKMDAPPVHLDDLASV